MPWKHQCARGPNRPQFVIFMPGFMLRGLPQPGVERLVIKFRYHRLNSFRMRQVDACQGIHARVYTRSFPQARITR
jgi:hypothetical protein